ncbi:hypothetical protein C453_08873 [Haloferax elongans ATCC BAA-1513]|uniref:Uncharacterized protein n=1 Tax=Haloferax elongans ATCC BAA-1513 TaxID=1230453 RepID=M0HN30_HALEO|nr:hypothetical protein [Haloferax elongans]ELZ85916.1 hypothetical protein C453_08873 [Haloferax elongans ATCC BAA-1513]
MSSVVPSLGQAGSVALLGTLVVAESVWLSENAAARGHGFPNLLGALLAVIPIGALAYLVAYCPAHPRTHSPSAAERVALTVFFAAAGSFAVVGSFPVSPPGLRELLYPLGLVVFLPFSHLVVYRRGYRVVTSPAGRQVAVFRRRQE